eukprot:8164-Heterococcus_DN1.PRE.8
MDDETCQSKHMARASAVLTLVAVCVFVLQTLTKLTTFSSQIAAFITSPETVHDWQSTSMWRFLLALVYTAAYPLQDCLEIGLAWRAMKSTTLTVGSSTEIKDWLRALICCQSCSIVLSVSLFEILVRGATPQASAVNCIALGVVHEAAAIFGYVVIKACDNLLDEVKDVVDTTPSDRRELQHDTEPLQSAANVAGMHGGTDRRAFKQELLDASKHKLLDASRANVELLLCGYVGQVQFALCTLNAYTRAAWLSMATPPQLNMPAQIAGPSCSYRPLYTRCHASAHGVQNVSSQHNNVGAGNNYGHTRNLTQQYLVHTPRGCAFASHHSFKPTA